MPYTDFNNRAMREASEQGNRNKVIELLDQGVNPDGDGILLPLCYAIRGNQLEIVKVLLERGASVNGINEKSYCVPIAEAASKGYVEVI